MTRSPTEILLGKALGKIPSGVYILTLRHQDVDAAALVSWVQQSAFAPPSISLALANDRPVAGLIQPSGLFCISVLGQGDTGLMKHFARGLEPGPDALHGVELGTSPRGQPYLADALAWLECRLNRVVDFGADHNLVIAEVAAGQMLKEGASFVHLRGSGFHY